MPVPILSSIDPTSGVRGQCYSFNAYGDYFDYGTINTSHWGLSVTGQSAAYNQISGTLCIDEGTSTGNHTIWVTTPLGTSGPKPFSVN